MTSCVSREVHPTKLIAKCLMAALVSYSITITAIRISILLLYRRLFRPESFRKPLIAVGMASLTWFIVAVLVNIFQCRPFNAAFGSHQSPRDHCINFQAFYWGICASNMALDIMVLCLPMRTIWKLQLATKQKVLLSVIFLLGGLSVSLSGSEAWLTVTARVLRASCV